MLGAPPMPTPTGQPLRLGERPDLLVLRAVRAVDPTVGLDAIVDVVVERGTITRLGPGAAAGIGGGAEISGGGRWLLPGLVDLHTHLREPGFEGKETIATGLRAAAAGGFVHVCPMANTRPVNDSALVTELMVSRAKDVATVRLSPIGAITLGQEGKALAEMASMQKAGAIGVSDDGRCVMSASVMRRAFEYATTHDLLVIQHAEDHTLTEGAEMHEGAISTRLGLRGWPRFAEDVIVARDLVLAEALRARYHVAHLSSHVSARLVREAKSRGVRVTAEVTPHHLAFTDAMLLGYDPYCKVNPPLREAADQDALWDALRDGTIDCVATDHAPHGFLDKETELSSAAPGLIGLETAVPLVLAEAMSRGVPLARMLEALSSAPAKIAGVEAPSLREGHPASFFLFDPAREWTVSREALRSKSTNTPLLGRALRGGVDLTLAWGAVAHERTHTP